MLKHQKCEPLVVSPKTTGEMLDYGPTKIAQLIRDGELESYLDGPRRKVTTASIKAFIQRRLSVESGRRDTPTAHSKGRGDAA